MPPSELHNDDLMATPAVFISSAFITSVGQIVRITFTEQLRGGPAHLRVAVAMTPECAIALSRAIGALIQEPGKAN